MLDPHLDETNPYRPPKATIDVPQVEFDSLDLASGGKRFLNLVIDYLTKYVLAALIAIFLLNTAQLAYFEDTLVDFLFGLVISVFYYTLFESLTGRSPAKWLTGTLVVSEDGTTPSFLQILGRSLARLIPFEAFSYLGDQRPVGWHDRLSKTRVIDMRKKRQRSDEI